MMKVLELFSGIGGMHMALQESGVQGCIVASIDINQWANKVYAHNFPENKLLNQNIEGLTPDFVNKLGVDTILMSPPCQPFTRNGLQKDIEDPRTNPFMLILDLLKDIKVDKLLIENVKGFEGSAMRDILIKKLKENNFVYQEFILTPTQVGVPNTRHRYYCLARKSLEKFATELPHKPEYEDLYSISNILETGVTDSYKIPPKTLLERVKILDVCHGNSRRSCCFTKAYGRFFEGTGSVFCGLTEKEFNDLMTKFDNATDDNKLQICDKLNIRFFTPKEISRLMSFPENFNFPSNITTRQQYALLGNSINIKVVSELIKLL